MSLPQSKRLIFRVWCASDLPLALALWGDPQVAQHISATGTFTEDEIGERLHAEIQRLKQFGVQYWPVFERETEELVGCCGLRPYDLESGAYELGIHLHPCFWGCGFALEGARAVIAYAFEKLSARALFAGHHPENTASRSLLCKLGFVFTHEEFYAPTGLQHPSYLLEKKTESNAEDYSLEDRHAKR